MLYLENKILNHLCDYDKGGFIDISHLTKASYIKDDPEGLAKLITQLQDAKKIILEKPIANTLAKTYEDKHYTIFCRITEDKKRELLDIKQKEAQIADTKDVKIDRKKGRRIRIVAIAAGAVAVIATTIITVNFSNKKGFKEPGSNLSINRDSVTQTPERVIIKKEEKKDSIKPPPPQVDYYIIKNALTRIEKDLIYYQQYAQACRSYLKLYDSISSSLKTNVSNQEIKRANDLYDRSKWQEAAFLMKKNIESIISN